MLPFERDQTQILRKKSIEEPYHYGFCKVKYFLFLTLQKYNRGMKNYRIYKEPHFKMTAAYFIKLTVVY